MTTKRTHNLRPRLTELMHTKEGFAKTRDGVKIWYQSQGKGTPIILCNGLACSTFFWKHIAALKKNHQVVMFDWRCHGKSETVSDPEKISIDTLTEDLHAVMQALKLKKAVLLGYSMGVQVVSRFIEKYPKRVRAIVSLCGTFGHPIDNFYNTSHLRFFFGVIYVFNNLFPQIANKIGKLFSKNPFWWEMGQALKMLNPGLADKKVLREYIEHITSMDSQQLATLTKSMQDYDAEPVLNRVKIPTLIIAAENDQFVPLWVAKKMHHLIAHSELMIIKKASHVALVEQPALINLRIEKFIKERLKV